MENLIAVFDNLFLCSLTDLEKVEGFHHLKYVGGEAYFKGMKYSEGLEDLNLVHVMEGRLIHPH